MQILFFMKTRRIAVHFVAATRLLDISTTVVSSMFIHKYLVSGYAVDIARRLRLSIADTTLWKLHLVSNVNSHSPSRDGTY